MMSESTAATNAAETLDGAATDGAPAPEQKPSETLGQAVTDGEFTYSTSTFTPATATLDELRNRMLLDQESDDAKLRYVPGEPLDPDPIAWKQNYPYSKKLKLAEYEATKRLLQIELLKLQHHVKEQGLKGGAIKRFMEHLNPRGARVVALEKPTDQERTQWYFQRYVRHMPHAGEIVLMDRSWYNRAGVERVMGFCTPAEYLEFLRQCPSFEKMLIGSGVILVKLWFSVGRAEQVRRFERRKIDPVRQWKLSPTDLASLDKWDAYTQAKEAMFFYTDTMDAPWTVVKSNDKKRARLNCMQHFLATLPYPNKSAKIVTGPDPLIVGTTAHVIGRDEHILGKTLHPEKRRHK